MYICVYYTQQINLISLYSIFTLCHPHLDWWHRHLDCLGQTTIMLQRWQWSELQRPFTCFFKSCHYHCFLSHVMTCLTSFLISITNVRLALYLFWICP